MEIRHKQCTQHAAHRKFEYPALNSRAHSAQRAEHSGFSLRAHTARALHAHSEPARGLTLARCTFGTPPRITRPSSCLVAFCSEGILIPVQNRGPSGRGAAIVAPAKLILRKSACATIARGVSCKPAVPPAFLALQNTCLSVLPRAFCASGAQLRLGHEGRSAD